MSGSSHCGRIVWHDLMTTDAAKAEAFYTKLFGWTVKSEDMGDAGVYRMLRNGDQDFGGMGQLDDGLNIPSSWRSYITVPNTDEATAKAAELGGHVQTPPTDIPNVGRFSVVADPTGAVFSPFQDPKAEEWLAQQQTNEAPVGSIVWCELTTTDPQRAKTFYSSIFGWTPEASSMGTGLEYTVFKCGDQMIAGLMTAMPEWPMSAWTIYFHVADIDQSLAEVSRLGGEPVSEVIVVPEIGRVSWATDPTGALFALHEDPKA